MTHPAVTIEIVGAGRMGVALVHALRAAKYEVPDPGPRGARGEHADVVILAVPDDALADAARHIAPGRLVGHLSGATPLAALSPHDRFGLHPLTTIAGPLSGPDVAFGADRHADGGDGSPFQGVTAAVSGSNEQAVAMADGLARTLGMVPLRIEEHDRAAYHAAASIASNYLITLEWFAEQLAQSTGMNREALVPLVSAAVQNWAAVGPEAALTGPIARGDAATVERQRAAVAERLPKYLALFDELMSATQELADLRNAPQASSLAQPRTEPQTQPQSHGAGSR